MPGIRLVLHDKMGNYQGVARVLRYEGHMLVYDPQTNGAGWVAMGGIPSLLTEVESRSVSDLDNFYPIPCTAWAGLTPHGDQWEEYVQTKAHSSKPLTKDFDMDWDTDDGQDQSCTPSPITNIDESTWGVAEDISPTCQNRCLVPECVPKAEAVPPRESALGMEEKTQKEESTPAGDEQSTPVAEDDVMIIYVGVEDLWCPPIHAKRCNRKRMTFIIWTSKNLQNRRLNQSRIFKKNQELL